MITQQRFSHRTASTLKVSRGHVVHVRHQSMATMSRRSKSPGSQSGAISASNRCIAKCLAHAEDISHLDHTTSHFDASLGMVEARINKAHLTYSGSSPNSLLCRSYAPTDRNHAIKTLIINFSWPGKSSIDCYLIIPSATRTRSTEQSSDEPQAWTSALAKKGHDREYSLVQAARMRIVPEKRDHW